MSVGVKDNRARELLACWRAGVAAADPREAVTRALDDLAGPVRRPWIISLGKASRPMADAALAWLEGRGGGAAGGLVVSHEAVSLPALESIRGDHPLPGRQSSVAADALGRLCRSLPAGAEVWVLLSGGTTSLIGGPATGLTEADLGESYRTLLESGLDIRRMNQVRKRLSRWGGGQLLTALGRRPILQLVVSDVPGDDLSAIGSGPLIPDRTPVAEMLRDLDAGGILQRLPARATARLQSLAAEPGPDPSGAHSDQVVSRIVVSNRIAIAAAADAGRRLGWEVAVVDDYLEGDAASWGEELARRLVALPCPGPILLVAGGETTVLLPPGHAAAGGRCQELALSAAAAMRGAAAPLLLLAAGTDGRDGPTEAAGAMVNRETWEEIRRAGGDPARALAEHASHDALALAGALVLTGPTGTNVADLVLAFRDAGQAPETSGDPAVR